jgi:hypothetical protein
MLEKEIKKETILKDDVLKEQLNPIFRGRVPGAAIDYQNLQASAGTTIINNVTNNISAPVTDTRTKVNVYGAATGTTNPYINAPRYA